MTNTTSSYFKWTTSFLAGVVLSGVASFFVLHDKLVTKEEVRAMILSESPYVIDKGTINTKLSGVESALGKLEGRIEALSDQVSKTREELFSFNRNQKLYYGTDRDEFTPKTSN